ncbi:hypothetical protein ACET3X_005957 [Alternaria dauci]|uniref:Uncharacterized protein n=1 Tax=Alternaria dauci TaxID=48095 RepID=A0ABR3UI88_9PLEO
MRCTAFITVAAFSSAVFAAASPQDDVASILEALRTNNPADADAAAAAMKVKLRRQDNLDSILAALEANNPDDAAAAKQAASSGDSPGTPVTKRQNGFVAIETNTPKHAAAAKRGAPSSVATAVPFSRRQDDVASILAALAQNNPGDAQAAQSLGKRWSA